MIQFFVFIISCAVGALALMRLFALRIEDFGNTSPAFNVRDYFTGEVQAWGMVRDWRGRVVKRFTVKMQGRWKGNKGEVEEFFTYDDGTTQQRLWVLELRDEHRFEGHAADIVGVASGEQYGNAIRLDYVLRLAVDGKEHDIRMDDWLFLQNDGVVLNETRMKFYGLPVGKVTTTFRKL